MKQQAVLLLGPTGAGKTPLGELMQEKGLSGLRCLHFDFGHTLRAALKDRPIVLSGSELEFVRAVLEAGALLNAAHFTIAE